MRRQWIFLRIHVEDERLKWKDTLTRTRAYVRVDERMRDGKGREVMMVKRAICCLSQLDLQPTRVSTRVNVTTRTEPASRSTSLRESNAFDPAC